MPQAVSASRTKRGLGRPRGRRAATQQAAKNKHGQSLGRKGTATRLRLIRAAGRLLKTRSPVELTAAAIAREAKTSSPTFYMYFDDVREVLFALSANAAQNMGDVLAVLEEDWRPDAIEAHAIRLTEAFYQFWSLHRPVLRYRNLEAARGDPDFDQLRTEAYFPFVEALATRIIEACPPAARPSRGDARALAGVLLASIEYAATFEPEAIERTIGLKRMKAAQARVIAQVIRDTSRGHAPLARS